MTIAMALLQNDVRLGSAPNEVTRSLIQKAHDYFKKTDVLYANIGMIPGGAFVSQSMIILVITQDEIILLFKRGLSRKTRDRIRRIRLKYSRSLRTTTIHISFFPCIMINDRKTGPSSYEVLRPILLDVDLN